MPLVRAGAVELWCEVRGAGPPVLCIMGATGDAGHFTAVADELADEFTVVAYDRRGNSRSPSPPDWTITSPEEQADDAAALLTALGRAPAAVIGSSSGAIFALCMAVRHPGLVRGAVLHEPAMSAMLERPEVLGETFGPRIRAGREAGGLEGGLEAFWRVISGEDNWERMDPRLRARMLGNAGTYFGAERGRFDSWNPDDAALAALAAPVMVLVSDGTLPFFVEMARGLAGRLGVEPARTPGTHTPYHDHPAEFAAAVRPFLRRVSTSSAP